MTLVFWYFAAFIGTVGSALFSGMETGTYTLNRIRLHLRVHAKQKSAMRLDKMLHSPNRLLGTLLISNNIVNYLASYAIAYILQDAGYRDWAMVFFNAAVLTPLLLIFGEILPKDLFRTYADRLSYLFANPLFYLQKLLLYTGLLPMVDLLSKTLQRLLGQQHNPNLAPHPRRVVTQLVREIAGIGVISAYQSNMAERILELEQETVGDVMIPWVDVIDVKATDPIRAVHELADREPYSVFPVIDDQGAVVGMVDVLEMLMKQDDTQPIAPHVKEIPRLPSDYSLRHALSELQEAKVGIAVVTLDEKTIGLVTTKNLVEPVIGEIEVW